MKNKKRKGYNTGGPVTNQEKMAVDQMSQIAGMIPGVGTAIGAGLGLVSALMPSSYNPVKYNTNPGFNNGGPIPVAQESTAVSRPLTETGIRTFQPLPVDTQPYQPNIVNKLFGSKERNNNLAAMYAMQQANAAQYNRNLAASGLQGKAYNKGGDIPLSEDAIEIKGNPGIDTNQRVVNGVPVNLTEGEVVKDADNSAGFVFSDSIDMLDPMTGTTFAKSAKAIEMKKSKAEKSLKKNPKDSIAEKTIEHLDKQLDDLANRQQQMNNNSQGQYLSTGGNIVDPLNPLATLKAQPLEYRNNLFRPLPRMGIPGTPSHQQVLPTLPSVLESNATPFGTLPDNVKVQAAPSHLAKERKGINLFKGIGQPRKENNSNGPLALRLGAQAGRLAMAMQPAQQYDTSMFNINPTIMDPTNALNQINRDYRATTYGINSGNASADRTFKANAYATALNAKRDTIRQYDEGNRDNLQKVNQYNMQSQARLTDINEQNRAAKTSEFSGILQDFENIGAELQNRQNSNIHNEITLGIVNQLSRYYGMPAERIMNIIQRDPARGEQMLMEFKNGN